MQQRIMPLLDNGHGVNCAGKRSPIWADGSQLFEWEFNRDIVRRIAAKLDDLAIRYEILTPETNDVSLQERCRRANLYQQMYNNCVLFSIHGNAGGGTGWECYTSKGTTKADEIATLLYSEAEKEFTGWKTRKDYIDGDADKEANFYILRHTICPAVLTENFFMDNEKDCKLMLSESGRERIAKIHINVIKKLAWGK
jgi:N-acetylmuramoyl-L-alanine amidase|nr:MAG TPA: Cell wall hydrolase autolysin [Caudoviricetes sp.]